MLETERNQPMRVMRLTLAVLAAQVGDGEGIVHQPHAEFERRLVVGARLEGGGDRRRHAAVPPCDDLAVGIDAGVDPFDRYGVIEVVLDVVLARPDDLDR